MIGFGAIILTFLLSPTDCAKIEGVKLLDDYDKVEAHFITPNPFPWTKITIPQYSYAEDNESTSPNSKIFKGFIIVLASILAITIFYYCRKICQCQKACSSLPTSNNSQQSRRNLKRNARNSPVNPNYVIRYKRGYQRMTSEYSPGSPRRHPRRNIAELHTIKHKNDSTSKPPEKPPDYSTVILNDLASIQVECSAPTSQSPPTTPPPSYDGENISK